MKKIVVLIILFSGCFLFTNVKAQSFMKGTKTINLGLGLGGYGLGLLGSAEVGVTDDISAGIVAGISRRSYGFIGSNWSVNYLAIGGRGSYHFGRILSEAGVNMDKLDPYLGVTLGFRSVGYDNAFDGYSGVGTGVMFGGYGGVRYQLNDKFALMAEGGSPFSSLGISFKL